MRKLRFRTHNRLFWQLVRCPGFWICALALILLFTLISKQEFWSGYDTYFHMNSIYESAMQIKTGHYSYFLSLFSFEQSGRIVNSLYGPIFNYLCGAILLLSGSWIHFEFIIFFVTLVICGSEFYICAKTLGITKGFSIILALAYMTSLPVRLLWLRNFEFTGLGAAVLLPLVLLMGIKMLKNRQIKIIPLAITMAICLQIHLMTSLIASLTLIPFFILGLSLSNNRTKMIKHAISSVILAICLSGNIFGAIYDVYSTNHLVPTFPNFHLQAKLSNKALFFSGRTIQGLGMLYTFLIVAVIVVILIRYRLVNVVDWCLLFNDIIFLWLSSAYFPWGALLRICPELASIIQFPVRFMPLVILITLLLTGRLFSKLSINSRTVIAIGLFIISLISVYSAMGTVHELSQAWQSNKTVQYWVRPSRYGGFSRDFHKGPKIKAAFRSHDLSKGINVIHKITPDYLPTSPHVTLQNYYHNPFNKDYIKIFKNQERFHKVTQNHTQNHGIRMTWQSNTPQTTQIPLIKYGRTQVMLNHRIIHPKRTLIGTMLIRPKLGINQLQMKYQPSKVFKVMSLITILSWLMIIIAYVHKKIID